MIVYLYITNDTSVSLIMYNPVQRVKAIQILLKSKLSECKSISQVLAKGGIVGYTGV